MVDFFSYMLFSSIEYFAMLFLTLAIFRFDWKHYKKELIITSIAMQLIAYVLIVTDLAQIWQFIQLPLLYIAFVIIFKQKKLYSLWLVLGSLSFLVVQMGVILVCLHFGLIQQSDLTQSFGCKVYSVQSIDSFVAMIVGAFIKYANQGFAYTFRSQLRKRLYITVALICLAVFSVGYYLFSSNTNYFYLSVSSTLVLFAAFMRYSFTQEREEFS